MNECIETLDRGNSPTLFDRSQGVFLVLATMDSAYTNLPLITQSRCTGSEAQNVHGCEFNSRKEHAAPTWVQLGTSGSQARLTLA